MKLPSKSGCRLYWLLAGNSSISLAGSEEQIIFFQQSPKRLKIVSENFIHALLWFFSLFLKISRWVPLASEIISRTLASLVDVFGKNEKKNKTTSVYRLT